jgi:hypothetical protein
MLRDLRVLTWAMRIIMQLRLSLPLDEALASGEPTCRAVAFRILCAIRRAISGAPATRQPHQTVLRQLVLIMQGVWGTLVEMEPQDRLGYSNDYRPDVSGRGLGKARTRLIGDVKFKGPPLSFVGKKLLGREANATTVRWRSFEQLRVVTARYSDVQPLLRFRDHLNGQGVASGVRRQFNAS